METEQTGLLSFITVSYARGEDYFCNHYGVEMVVF